MDQEELLELLRKANQARDLGFSPDEINAAIAVDTDNAITDVDSLKVQLEATIEQTRPITTATGVRTAAQGLTARFGDEIEAFIRTLGARPQTVADTKSTFIENRDEIRADIQNLRDQPGSGAGFLEAAGAGPLGLLPLGMVKQGASLASQVGRGALAGGLAGGLTGIGGGTDARSRAAGGLVGGGLGALVGGAVPAAIGGVRSGVNTLRSATGRGASNAADDLVTREVGRAGGPDALLSQLSEGDVLADLSPGLTRLGRASQAIPNESNLNVHNLLSGRNQGFPGGVRNALSARLGLNLDDINTSETRNALLGRMRQNAQGAYDAAYAVGVVDDPDVSRVLATATSGKVPAVRRAWQRAIQLADLDGDDISTFVRVTDDGIEITPTVKALDYFKRGIDDEINAGFRSGGIGSGTAASIRRNIRDPLLEALDEAVPEYSAARSLYAGDIEALDALEAGRAAINHTANQIADETKDLAAGSRDMFRLGWMDRAGANMDRVNPGTALNQFAKSTLRDKQLRTLFPRGDVDGFADDMAAFVRQRETSNTVLGGSPTARVQGDVGEFFGSPGLLNAISQQRGPGDIARAGVSEAAARLGGTGTARVANQTANRLFQQDPRELLIGLQGSGDLLRRRAAGEARRNLTGSLFGGLLGGGFGRSIMLDQP